MNEVLLFNKIYSNQLELNNLYFISYGVIVTEVSSVLITN